jgi:PAS domain S-box-containing protein
MTDLRVQGQHVGALLSAATLDAVITEDAPLLETIVRQATLEIDSMTSITVRNEQGDVLTRISRYTDGPQVNSVTYVNPIIFEGENYGDITIDWDNTEKLERINSYVFRVRLYALLTLLCAAALFYGLFRMLVVVPLTRLKERTEAIHNDTPSAAITLPPLCAADFIDLNNSLLLLENTLIDNRKQHSQLLRGRKRMEALAAAAIDCIIATDERGLIVEFNAAAESCFGYQRAEVLNQPLTQFLQCSEAMAIQAPALLNELLEKTASAADKRVTVKATRAQGPAFPAELVARRADEDDLHGMVVIYLRDVTERQKAEKEIRALAKFPDESPSPILRIGPCGTVIYANPQAHQLLSDWFTGQQPSLTGDIAATVARAYETLTPQSLERSVGERHFTFVCHAVPEGPYVNVYGFDVTEKHLVQQALLNAKEQAESATRAKTGFLATMSHEIRTPLNGVLGLLGLLKDTTMTPEQKRYTTTAEASARALLSIINDVLDYSKMEADKLMLEVTDLDIRALLDSVVLLLEPTILAKGLSIEIVISPLVPTILRGDSGRLRQVFLNLVGNAVKFSDTGLISLRIDAQGTVHDDHCELHCEVNDQGPGIPADKIAGLFSDFSTLDASYSRRYGGTGLGLAISRRLIEMMGGSIEVDSVEGLYTTFRFTCRLDIGHTNIAATIPVSSARLDSRTGRILIVEDNQTNCLVFSMMLKKLGFQVHTASNGIEAVSAVRELPFDAILMDVSMPEMDGLQATRAIRKLAGPQSQIPIIALTAHTMSGDREKAIAAGMNDYLEKPIIRERLVEAVDKWLQ